MGRFIVQVIVPISPARNHFINQVSATRQVAADNSNTLPDKRDTGSGNLKK